MESRNKPKMLGFPFKVGYFGYLISIAAILIGLTFRNETHNQTPIGLTKSGELSVDHNISDELKQTIRILSDLTRTTHSLGSYENEVAIPNILNSYMNDFINDSKYLAQIASSTYYLCVNSPDIESEYFKDYCQAPLDDKEFNISSNYFNDSKVIKGIKDYLKPFIELSDGAQCLDTDLSSNLLEDKICSEQQFPVKKWILLPSTSKYFNQTHILEEHEIPSFCNDLLVFDLSFYDNYSGAFSLGGGHSYYYTNISGMAMRITPFSAFDISNGPAMVPSVMLTSHYDSAFQSPGGSDAGSCVAIGMEVMRSLLHENSNKIKSSLLFFFNGCEESFLTGAHGFAKLHPWSRLVASLINLEALGNSGKEVLFQVSSKHEHLIKLYSKVINQPSTQSFLNGLFKSKIVPSTTDFRVYNHIYDIGGVDFALNENCYFYHTTMDQSSSIPLETLQHYLTTIKTLTIAMGNDVGEKMKHLRDSVLKDDKIQVQKFYTAFPYSKSYESSDKYTFFDIFGTYTIVIPSAYETYLCIAFLIIWFYTFYYNKKVLEINPGLLFLKHFILLTIYFIAIMLINFSMCAILHLMKSGLFFYSQPTHTILFYAISSFVFIYGFHYSTDSSQVSDFNYSLKLEQADFNAFICLWSYMLVFSTFNQQVSATYIPLIWLLFGLMGRLTALFIISTLKKLKKTSTHSIQFQVTMILTVVQTTFLTVPCLLMLKISRSILLNLMPMEGLSPMLSFPVGGNLAVVITIISLFTLCPYLIGLRFVEVKYRNLIKHLLYVLFLCLMIYTYLMSLHTNFTTLTPKRLHFQQTQMCTQYSNGTRSNYQSGIIIHTYDTYGLTLPMASSNFSIEQSIISQLSKNNQNENVHFNKIKYLNEMKFDWPFSIAISQPDFINWISHYYTQRYTDVESFIINNNNKENYTLGLTTQHENLIYERTWNYTSPSITTPTTIEWTCERSPNSPENKLVTLKISSDSNLRVILPSKDLVSWPFSKKEHSVRKPNQSLYIIFLNVGKGDPIFTFQVEILDSVKTLELSTSSSLSYLTPDLIELVYGNTLPDWIVSSGINIEVTHWVIELS